ncbi:hypothetical protein ACOMHN_031704 [Nucella lapillus]
MMAEDGSKGENLVSSSTAVVTKGEQGQEEVMGTERLPQTYRASPPPPSHPPTPATLSHPHPLGPETLPHTAITTATVYTTVAQSTSYVDSEVHRSFAMAGHLPYPSTDASVTTTTVPLHEQISYVSGGTTFSSSLMTQAGDLISTEPIDFRRSSVSAGSEVVRMNVGEGTGGEAERSTVSLAAGSHTLGVAHPRDVSRELEPHSHGLGRVRLPQTADRGPEPHNLGRVTLPQTADIARLSSQDLERAIIHAHTMDIMSGPQMREAGDIISAPGAEDLNTRSGSVGRVRMNEHHVGSVSVLGNGESLRKHTAVDHVDRINLSTSVARGSPHGSDHVRMSTARVSGMSSVDTDTRQLPVHEQERYWITVPVSGHSLPITDISKMSSASKDGGEGIMTTVSLASNINAVNALSAGGIPATDMSNVRTVVMSQMDDFSRMGLVSAAGVISTAQNEDGGPLDTIATHGMDIKYSDLIARSSVADMGQISVLQTPGGYGYDEDRLSLPHMQEAGDMSEQHQVDTKPIILPQTGDVSIVTYPQVGDGVGAMAVPQSGNISMVILPQTGDVGQMSVDHCEVRRIDLMPTDDGNMTEIQTVDGSRMNIQQDGNVIRISLPAPGDISRYHLPDTDGSQVHIQQIDGNRTILPQTSEIRSVELEDKADVSRMIALQNRDLGAVELPQKYDINRVLPFQSAGVSDMRLPRASDANAIETHQMYEVRTNRSGEISADTRQHMFDATTTNPSQASDIRPAARPVYSVNASVMSQAGDLAGDRQRMYGVGRTAASHTASPVELVSDRQQVYSVARSGAPQTMGISAGEKPQVYDVARTRIPQASKAGTVDRQQMYSIRTDPSQAGEVTVMDRTGGGRVNLVHSDEASLMRVHQVGDFKMSSAAYTDSGIMTLPQTSGVKLVSLPYTEEIAEPGTNRPSVSFDVNTMNIAEQPHPEYSMRVMAEAAEIMISTGSIPADDINMRLMAETADFVSRNDLQTAVKNTAGSVQKIQDVHTASEDSKTKMSQNIAPAEAKAVEELRSASEKKTTIVGSSGAADSANITRSYQGKGGLSATTGQKGSGERWRGRSGSKGESKGKHQEKQQSLELGFWIQFLNSQSYLRWKDIGHAQGFSNDEEIACFLMKYYDSTSGVFPSGRSTCDTCQKEMQVSCISCSPKAAAGNTSSKDTKRDNNKDARRDNNKKGSNDRTKLWKLIVESSPSKEKGEEKGKEDKSEKRHRRKPRQTRRVLRRRVIVSPPRSSDDDDSQDEPDSDTNTSETPPPPARVRLEEEKKNTPTAMVTRKRGRPSNDSYHQASTLECPGCQRKFHTAVGLDQHIKRKRCKASKLGAASTTTPKEKEPETSSSDKTLTPFQFKCSDCGKEYRSKQGLLLHRISKHGEENESIEMVLPEGDDEDDTDEYVPDQKDGTPKVFQCSVCQKEYRSKQGLLMHKASKHGGPAEKKIKVEKEGENNADESEEEARSGGVESFKCTECNKTYNSRPGYMLHMKTKHFPMILRECPECEEKFKTKVELRIHIRREHNKGMLILFCPYCPSIFHNRNLLRSHMDDNHKTCRRVLFDCVACDLQFSSRIERKRHIQSEHKGKDTSLTCHYCGSWFATRYEYDEHEKAGHPDQSQEWLCATCGDSFPTRYLLQRHALTHKEKILCPLCNKYITEPCYEDHMKRHYGNKTWKCEVCPKSFIRKAELQQHTLVHKDERPFCCEQCGMRYREKSRLNSHMRTHTGIKPYKCQQCEKCFTRSRELKNHMRVHTGEKPFACAVCGRRFASSGNLSAHRRKVHKLEPIPHGQQSRKHTLEESIKPENKVPDPPPAAAPPSSAPGEVVVVQERLITPSGVSLEMTVDAVPGPAEAPMAHSSLTLQAPAAHQAPVAHQDQAVLYQQQQQHMIPKYESPVTQPDTYIPQPVGQQAHPSLAIYWPNTSYGEES